jgi:hypothetical protein
MKIIIQDITVAQDKLSIIINKIIDLSNLQPDNIELSLININLIKGQTLIVTNVDDLEEYDYDIEEDKSMFINGVVTQDEMRAIGLQK